MPQAATKMASEIVALYFLNLPDGACLAVGSFLTYTGVLGTFVNTPKHEGTLYTIHDT